MTKREKGKLLEFLRKEHELLGYQIMQMEDFYTRNIEDDDERDSVLKKLRETYQRKYERFKEYGYWINKLLEEIRGPK